MLFEQIQDWATEGDMDGFDTLAATEVGDFDYMSLIKGGAGMLSGAGGLMSGGSSGARPDAAAAAQQAQIQAAKAQAEASARTWKIVGGIALGVIALVGLGFVMRPAAPVKAVA
jgi:membrane protease subunit (stomatin/prohibitin family)